MSHEDANVALCFSTCNMEELQVMEPPNVFSLIIMYSVHHGSFV